MDTKFAFLMFDEEKGYETVESPVDQYGQISVSLRPNFKEDKDRVFVNDGCIDLAVGNKVSHMGKHYMVMDKKFEVTEESSTMVYVLGPTRDEYRDPSENEIAEHKNYCRKKQIEAQIKQNSPIALPGVSANMANGNAGKIINLR